MNEFVVGLDGSDQSRMALRWAAAAADAAGVPVRAVQSWIHSRAAVLPVASAPVASELMDEQTEQTLTATVSETLGSSAAVAAGVLRGPPAGALLDAVTPDSVLVLGSRGLGGFGALLLGSVSQECVEYASSPVVVVRTERTVGEGHVILVGKDGWAQQVDDEIESDEVEGDPRDVLVTAAERLAPALTVVGRRGAGGLRSMRLGSTANHLVRHCTTDVAVVPTPDP
jgi:nucleotide-binding universal stress UspA family protein